MKKIFIMNGMGGSGKDTFVGLLNEFVPTMHISIVDKVKDLARQIGWEGTKTEKDRKFLFDMKEIIDNYNDANYNDVAQKVRDFKDGKFGDVQILCIDIRENGQIERAKKDFGAESVLIYREGVKNITTNRADANVFNVKYDHKINNSGSIDELRAKAKEFVESLR